jgi:branched-chain amino acid transport system ATP-binding protein
MENLELGAYGPQARKAFRENLEFVFKLFPRLKERRRQQAVTLSGGEQQMLAIGRGIMSQPQLMMLDEPSLGLAPKLMDDIFETVISLHTKGLTLLLVEQNARRALELSDRAYIFENGSVALEGSGKELMRDERVSKAYLGL